VELQRPDQKTSFLFLLVKNGIYQASTRAGPSFNATRAERGGDFSVRCGTDGIVARPMTALCGILQTLLTRVVAPVFNPDGTIKTAAVQPVAFPGT